MKLVSQFFYIMLFTLLGELLSHLVPLPIPSAIYGMLLLYFSFHFRVLKVEQVETVGTALVRLMPLLLVSPGVNLMDCWGILGENLWQVIVIITLPIFVVMLVSGSLSQWLNSRRKEHTHG